ncbi:hypothetical protein N7462_007495 [Penicillium macrosclerotiorum]|uniref:uncharacterized protein n=1 Tax=Penicillium macrosclerotiorum TaxID=303699 RepID=UPI0025493ECA|nr:uncharacterized protein N7462_007495 [Penicillium macrosclerotiorum]KAJ5679251.1 hypothetical protein N7462_007495 [Penicillium macrosclerotiorum]
MPYTAPLKSLLAAQHIEYSDRPTDACSERPGLVRSASARLQNSRAYSSTSYVRRHRRSPSICKSPQHASSDPASRLSPPIDPHASLRQSPPPLNNASIPPGAVISPPESAPNSDEESPCHGSAIKLEELEAAVRSIEQRKESSPERESMGPAKELGTEARSSSSVATHSPQSKPNYLRLSKESRKIAHSRSSTETAIDLKREEALTSSPDDSDAETSPKPPMVRKKSGELVRPALRPPSARRRPSSMPGTPVYAKAVHFDSQLEHIRHFLQLDRPLAVSAETSPVDNHDADNEFPFGSDAEKRASSWEWELRLPNFPKDMSSCAKHPVRLEKLYLSADKNVLIGSVAVANLAFHKHVAARFTFDYWRTVSEVGAVYFHDIRRKHAQDGHDRFSFEIKLDDQANLEHKTMFVCIRYNVDGQEFWDNNQGMNYQVDFLKTQKTTVNKPSGGVRPALPRSRTFTDLHSASRPHSTSFDDFPGSKESNKNVPFSNPFSVKSKTPLDRKSSDDIDTVGPPKRREKPHPQAFGNRYDFGASLTAAMKTKPPLDRTTLTARARSTQGPEADEGKQVDKAPQSASGQISSPVRDGSRNEDLKPSSLVSSKPCHESSVYKELVDKYCFYGSPTKASNPTSPQLDLTSKKEEAPNRFFIGAPSPPLSPRSPAPLQVAQPAPAEPPRSESRPASLSPASLSPRASPRVSPAINFRYPYQQTMQNGFMKDPHSSPVIRG